MRTKLEEIEEFVEDILGLDDDMTITHIVIALERIVEYLKQREEETHQVPEEDQDE